MPMTRKDYEQFQNQVLLISATPNLFFNFLNYKTSIFSHKYYRIRFCNKMKNVFIIDSLILYNKRKIVTTFRTKLIIGYCKVVIYNYFMLAFIPYQS